jgi:glyoxylase-like metal-dependent hydrolase (beta-lactamase superfamily II)/rhodanese-related sulfurtransferase
MIFHQFQSGGCCSYLIGCESSAAALLVDPSLDLADRYAPLAAAHGLRIWHVVETHTHADHFSAAPALAEQLGAAVVMHRESRAPFVDVRVRDGETIVAGTLRIRVVHTPGHTSDSICLVLADRVLTGDTLLLGSVGRTDLPTGDAAALYDSLFEHVLTLDPALLVYPAHNYRAAPPTTLGEQRQSNPRLNGVGREEFIARAKALDLQLPEHLTEALRTNCSGARPVSELIRAAARSISFIGLDELRARIEAGEPNLVVVDVREAEAFRAGHIPGARHIPRGQLELVADGAFPDPDVRILTYCQFGKISTLAAATLRSMGFRSAVALDGGFRDWLAAGHPVEQGTGEAKETKG